MSNFDQAANPFFNSNIKKKYIEFLSSDKGYNPNSNHQLGEESRKIILEVKEFFKSKFPQYDFIEFIAGGGTQANKRAILGSISFNPKVISKELKLDTIVLSRIEHKS